MRRPASVKPFSWSCYSYSRLPTNGSSRIFRGTADQREFPVRRIRECPCPLQRGHAPELTKSNNLRKLSKHRLNFSAKNGGTKGRKRRITKKFGVNGDMLNRQEEPS
jgi:hypothetical protein